MFICTGFSQSYYCENVSIFIGILCAKKVLLKVFLVGDTTAINSYLKK